MSNLQRNMMKSRLPPTGLPNRMARIGDPAKKARAAKDYSPTQWSEYFAEMQDVELDEKNIYRIYRTKEPAQPGPLLVMLHGGGYSALTWALFSVEISKLVHCQCLSIDLRGHGDTVTENDEDLSAQTLASDVGKLLNKIYSDDCPPILLVGHSMGGAIVVHLADMEILPSLIGVTVIDVVEGTAMDALASMQSFLRSRPNFFKSIPHAIEWCVRSGQVRNVESAKVSMPGQIINYETKKLATNELPLDETLDGNSETTKYAHPLSISEDEEADCNGVDCEEPPAKFKVPSTNNEQIKGYTWRINLSKSEKYWVGWFDGLSEKFLSLRVPKLLLLASIDGLDKTLTVGQMQGKFQMQVLARCGHAVQEDRPHEVAEVIGSYLLRNRFAQAASDFLRHMPAC